MVLIIVSCSQRTNQNQQIDIGNQTEPKTNSVSSESKFDFYSNSVLTHIDAEELCEFSFDFFLPQLNRKLMDKDLKLDVQTTTNYENSFEIEINGRNIKLYSNEELLNGSFWESGPRNFFKVVNDILKDKNIDKKFYLLYGGNDLHVAFLTEKQFESLTKINKDNKNEIPYLP